MTRGTLRKPNRSSSAPQLPGLVKRHPDGYGFFIPDDKQQPDAFIPRPKMKGIMTNDKVIAEIYPEKGGDRFRAQVVQITQRAQTRVVGHFYPLASGGGIIPDEGNGWGQDLRIKSADVMEAKEGDLVAVEVRTFPDRGKRFTGVVVEVIGDALDPMNDIRRVVHTHNIPYEFPASVEKEASHFTDKVDEKDLQGRRDLRELKFVTIDGVTAKDFDDAIYVESNKEGFCLWVAIADVSHYVKVGSAIDKEAYERGNSSYFPNFVVPMLPEVLSNGLCSLNPHLPRLAMVAEMQLSFEGELLRSKFYEAVMESHSRVTYGEAQDIIDGQDIEKHAHVKKEILLASDLAKILMARRMNNGSLDLNVAETEVVVDGAGIPVDIIKSTRLFAHRVIEEMMLTANVAVAEFFVKKEIPGIYRIHEEPDPENIKRLSQFIHNFGGRENLSQGNLQKNLTRALANLADNPKSEVLSILTLRSMNQAVYSNDNVGHFGLGFENYTHFTSPIRRYSDLIVHRLLKALVMKDSDYQLVSEEDLETAGSMLSACEQRSVKAERQLSSIKRARFMSSMIGQEFEGMISSVAKFGIFVLLRDFDVDGLVPLENLGSERFEFDPDFLTLRGDKTGALYEIGQSVTIQVRDVNVEEGKIDFVLAGSEEKSFQKPAKRKLSSKKKTSQKKPQRGKAAKRSTASKSKKKLRKTESANESSSGGQKTPLGAFVDSLVKKKSSGSRKKSNRKKRK